MSTQIIRTAVTANANTAVALEDIRGSGTNILQVNFSGSITGSVRLFGRVSEDLDFVEMTAAPITGDALFPVLPVPLLRAEVTVTGGTGFVTVRSAL